MVLHRDIRERVNRSLHILEMEYDKDEHPVSGTTCSCASESTSEPPVSAQLQKVKRLGFKMFPVFFFPALPKIIQDIWVAVELFVTFFELLFACITYGSGGIINTLVVVLTVINLILASLDSFLYFVEGGSCVSLYRWGRKQLRKGRKMTVRRKQPQSDSITEGEATEDEARDDDNSKEESEEEAKKRSSCIKFYEQVKKVFATGSEVIRIALTELLLYPLTVLDILELIGSETYHLNTIGHRINFSLLIIGLFYLVLTVYLIRILISVSALVSISRLPKTTHTDYHNLLKRFLIHLLSQLVVHMAILIMVSTKIDSELCRESAGTLSGSGVGEFSNETITESRNTSPFLYITIITGDLIPFLGVFMFFVVNYPALKQFMMGFCIDLMSTVVSEDFASTAFAGKGIKNVSRKASVVHVKVNLASVRNEFNLYKNVFSFKKKLSYRLTNPLVMILSGAYFALIALFLTCHAIGLSDPCDSMGGVKFITFSDHAGTFVTFVIGLVAILVANYQVVLMSVIWLLALIGLVVFTVAAPLVALLLAPLIALVVLVKSCI